MQKVLNFKFHQTQLNITSPEADRLDFKAAAVGTSGISVHIQQPLQHNINILEQNME